MTGFRTGELVDLSISSYNNPFGKEKIDYLARDGVQFDVQKYIDELEALHEHDPTVKTEKREQRLALLRLTSQRESASYVFKRVVGYLNGCYDSTASKLNTQSVVVVTTGGNIYAVYAGLMLEAITSESGLQFLSRICELDIEMLRGMQGASPSNPQRSEAQAVWFKALVIVAEQGFSDLDFCMVPGKDSAEQYRQRHYEWDGYHSGYEESEYAYSSDESDIDVDNDDAGFVLFRLKTSQKVDRGWLPPSNLGCWNLAQRLNREDLEPTGPFQLKNLTAYFDSLPPTGDQDTNDCFAYLRYLQFLREDSEEQTKTNVNILSDILDKQSPSFSKYVNMAYYIHMATDAMNKQIVSLLKKPSNRAVMISDRAFDSLSTILEDRSLVFLGAKLIDFYANFPTLRVEELTEAINGKTGLNQVASVFRPAHADAQSLINAERVFRNRMTDNLGFVDGVRLTINAVETDNNPTTVEEGSSEDGESMLEGLSVE